MTAIIVEDEPIAFRRLKRLIHDSFGEEIEIVAHFDSVEDTANYLIHNEHPDMIFLDIQLSDGNSFDLFDLTDIQSNIVFTTAFDDYAVEAFRKNAVDYLLKPIKVKELKEAVEKGNYSSTQNVQNVNRDLNPFRQRFLIKFGSRLYSIKSSEIAYIFSENKLSFFVLKSGKKIASDFKLQDLDKWLDPSLFFRANRQFIIHIDSIAEMTAYSKSRIKLQLNPPSQLELIVSTETSRKFKSWLSS